MTILTMPAIPVPEEKMKALLDFLFERDLTPELRDEAAGDRFAYRFVGYTKLLDQDEVERVTSLTDAVWNRFCAPFQASRTTSGASCSTAAKNSRSSSMATSSRNRCP